jgi:hypothetical protein
MFRRGKPHTTRPMLGGRFPMKHSQEFFYREGAKSAKKCLKLFFLFPLRSLRLGGEKVLD